MAVKIENASFSMVAPQSTGVFCVLCGVCMIAQAWLTANTLSAALPRPHTREEEMLTLRFAHPCLPLAPVITAIEWVPSMCAVAQAAAGAMMSVSAARCLHIATRADIIAIRAAAALGAASVAFMLLVEAAVYQNHFYLLMHLLLCIAAVPICDAPDGVGGQSARGGGALRFLLRFMTSVPYIYGALAKALSADWLPRYEPTRRWCERELLGTLHTAFEWSLAAPLVTTLIMQHPEECAAVLAWGGVVIDALVVPLLALPPPRSWLRPIGIAMALSFHACNWLFFHIGVFPLVMICSLVLWRADNDDDVDNGEPRRAEQGLPLGRQRWSRAFCAAFVAFHLMLPLRRLVLDPTGDATWTQEGYLGSWMMKLHQTDGLALVQIELEGEEGGKTLVLLPQLDPWLTPHQRRFVAVRPAAMAQYAAHRVALLAQWPPRERAVGDGSGAGSSPPACDAVTGTHRVHVHSCFSHNRRPPQPLYAPGTDVAGRAAASALRCFGPSGVGDWLLPLDALTSSSRRPPDALASIGERRAPPCDPMLWERPQRLLTSAEEGFRTLRARVRARARRMSYETTPEPPARAEWKASVLAEPQVEEDAGGMADPWARRSLISGEAAAWFWHLYERIHQYDR